MFGGPAWTRVEDGQWYLHLFDASQPDLDWWNPEIHDEFEKVLRFWLDRGVDGFRVDVAHGLYKEGNLTPRQETDKLPQPMWDQPEVHDVYRRWRTILDEYPGDRMAVAEACAGTPEAMARYIRPDELQQTFNFTWLEADWSAEQFEGVVVDTFDSVRPVGGTPTWVLANHDVVRESTRYGGGPAGVARGNAAALTMLALPGSAYVYQGEELGLEQVDVPVELRQDPAFFRGAEPEGRDGCRVPIPWSGDARAVRLRVGRRPAVAAAARRLGPPHRRGAARRRGLDAAACSGGCCGCAARSRRGWARPSRSWRPGRGVRLPPRRPGVRGQLRHRRGRAARGGRRPADQQRPGAGRRPARAGHGCLVPRRLTPAPPPCNAGLWTRKQAHAPGKASTGLAKPGRRAAGGGRRTASAGGAVRASGAGRRRRGTAATPRPRPAPRRRTRCRRARGPTAPPRRWPPTPPGSPPPADRRRPRR